MSVLKHVVSIYATVCFQASLFLERVCAEFDRCPAGLQKGKTFKEASEWHSSAGVFLHLLSRLQESVPKKDYDGAVSSLRSQWLQGLLDSDLAHMLDSTVPPGNLSDITAFRLANTLLPKLESIHFLCRPFINQIEKRLQTEQEEKARSLAKKVSQATLEHLEAKIGVDLQTIEKHMPAAESEAIAVALDMKYIRGRQQILGQ